MPARWPITCANTSLTSGSLLNILAIVCETTFEGTITLLLAPLMDGETRFIAITVVSTGMKLAETNWARIFEAFQLSESHNLGLRLPLAKALIELQGGTMRVKSHPHEGTTFTITILAAAKPQAAPKTRIRANLI